MSKITELTIGKVVEINEQGEKVVTNPGKTIKGKGSFFFTRKADKKYKSTDKEGNEIDGVSAIFNDLTMYNDMALIKFWDCAAANHPSLEVTEEEIIEEIQKIADEQGTAPLFAGALEVFTKGFYKDKVDNQDFMMQLSVSKEKDPEKKAELEGNIEMLKEIRNHVANTSITQN
ncbi:tail assembly chaperone [Macrococcus brunensis]|uniref:tail assembly chaperone n=1 Tax=Macrococcus brunensis TaxID=198483 RepID=UPI001EEF9140|nr:tail assembly chaperone [Macrococcus brunensis]ULG73221.1 tail assembly chaperone [Macrococcus brunensis]